MFNILIDTPPERVAGKEVYTSYRNMILFEKLMLDKTVPEREKILLALGVFYKEPSPEDDPNFLFAELLRYYQGTLYDEPGDHTGAESKGKRTQSIGRLYDFDAESDLIYAAFLDGHGIRLQEHKDMHWWEFKSLLFSVPPNTVMHERIAIRSADLSQYKGEERKRLQKRKRDLEIERITMTQPKSVRERDQKFMERVRQRQAEAEKWNREHTEETVTC